MRYRYEEIEHKAKWVNCFYDIFLISFQTEKSCNKSQTTSKIPWIILSQNIRTTSIFHRFYFLIFLTRCVPLIPPIGYVLPLALPVGYVVPLFPPIAGIHSTITTTNKIRCIISSNNGIRKTISSTNRISCSIFWIDPKRELTSIRANLYTALISFVYGMWLECKGCSNYQSSTGP